jgi:DNA polymerase-3 subunit delta'
MLFRDITGQQEVINRLIHSVKESRVSHAQLLAGPEGTGKLALALAYARYLNCLNPSETDSCGTCSSCHKINKLIHPDIHFVFPIINAKKGSGSPICEMFLPDWRTAFLENPYITLNQWLDRIGDENKQAQIYAGEASEILHKLSLKSYEARFKTMIIWLPEKMNIAASNKLLKLIEEPPERTVLLLVTENIEQILLTIRSRTQLIKVPRVSDEDIFTHIVDNNDINTDEARKIARLSNGNFSLARELIYQSESRQEFHTQFTEVLRKSYAQNYSELIVLVENISEWGREKIKQWLSYGIELLRQSFMINLKTPELAFYSDFEQNFVEKFSSKIHRGNVEKMIFEIQQAHFHISRNGYQRLVLLDMGLKLTRIIHLPPEN